MPASAGRTEGEKCVDKMFYIADGLIGNHEEM